MRDSKRFIGMALLLLIGMVLKFGDQGENRETVDTFRGASIKTEIWNPLIAESVNEKEISVLIDNKKITSTASGLFMDENLNLMVPVSVLRDSFNCSVHMYGDDRLMIEKRTNEIAFTLGEKAVAVNRKENEIASPMIQEGGEFYVPAGTVSELLDFSYQWNIKENEAVAVNNAGEESIFPTRYDLREKMRTPPVKDQGRFGTCWAFAALSAMESALLPEEALDFSPDHMSLRNSFNLKQADGGEYTMGMAYLTAWQGPVYEADDPYGDDYSPEGLAPVKHVQEIQIIEPKEFEKIKEAVFKYGGVQTSIYSALRSSKTDSDYYNSETGSYCYIGTEKPNHDVLIIGWDDNFSKDNFNMPLEGDGAFICQNSWGTEFGDNGVFYISYHDVNVGIHNEIYTGIEDADNYGNIYQTDLCGWVGQLGFERESIYGANVYTARGAETLRAAGFYATGKDTEYQIYIVKNFTDTSSLTDRELAAEGKMSNAGYYTIDFDHEIAVEPDERYAVVLYVSTPGSVHPLAIEYEAGETTSQVDLSDGEGYYSVRGTEWESSEQVQNSNICLKVYSDNR